METKKKQFNYKEQYGVIVICKNEAEQKGNFRETDFIKSMSHH